MRGGGGSVALAQQPPPTVTYGTAHDICRGIRQAGYSPHDYIYRVVSYVYRGERVDYSHVAGNAEGRILVWIYQLPILFNAQNLITNPVIVSTTDGGTITALDGSQVPLSGVIGGNTASEGGSGLSGYRYTPPGGSPMIFRDHTIQIASAGRTEWRYLPNWSGPDGARMSAIWASVPACAN